MKTSLSARLGLVLVAAVVAIAVLYARLGDDSPERDLAAEAIPQPERAASGKTRAVPRFRQPVLASYTRPLEEGAFTPQRVLDNRDCHFQAGHGNSAGTGLVVLPDGEGARFEVLDAEGRLFGGALPFLPNHYRVARHSDGSVLAGFGDLRLNSQVYREENTPEPVRIYRDGDLIYEVDRAWNFGLAPTGSAFFVIEPTAGSASQLVIYNLDQGTQHQHDLGYEYTPVFDELPYSAHFTLTGGEVMLAPAFMSGGKSHVFFPVDGGDQKEITLRGGGYAVFASMHSGYYAFTQGENRPFLIQKKAVDWDASNNTPEVVDEWSREIDFECFYGAISLSNDGSWLILKAWELHVFDANSGETVFSYPIVSREAEQLARLSTVLEPGATAADIGGVNDVKIRDGLLLMYRKVDSPSLTKPAYFFDVFAMAGIQLDSKPMFWERVDPDNRCMAGEFSLRGLQVVNGALTYLTRERGADES